MSGPEDGREIDMERRQRAMLEGLSGKRVLVTGADGFIGSHLVEGLVRQGAKVTALAYYNSIGSWGWLDDPAEDVRGRFEVVLGDIRDPHFVDGLVAGQEIVLHLAALIAIPFSYVSPAAYVDTNVHGTLNVLQAARRHGTGRVVCTSTSEVYGTAQYVPIDEAHPLNGQSPYAASKVGADQMALAFQRSFGTPVVLLRPFNTFGPRQSARAVIPTIISQIASGANQVKLGSLHPTRDFSFVTDTARAFMHAAVAEGCVGETINSGSGFEISVGDTAALIAEVMGAKVEVVCANERVRPEASEVERLFAGVEKAQRCMGWTPEFGGREGFARGLGKTIDWFREPANLARYRPERYAT
jgi:dTDP-glucose 4,6-dehydratase